MGTAGDTAAFAVVEALLAERNQYLSDHPRAHVEVALRRVRDKIAKPKLRFVSVLAGDEPRQLRLQIDADARAEIEKLEGCYVIKTELPAAALDKAAVHDRYKDLAEVEWAFRTAKKSFLETPPVYVRGEKSTRGHVFVVMLAYLIVHALRADWAALNLTVEEGLTSLSTLCTMHLYKELTQDAKKSG